MARSYTTDTARWAAVCKRDAAADGAFVYAVKTTKIYCRPVCKARLARRANVDFYGDSQSAKESGFRACKRCKPQVDAMPEAAAVSRIRSMIEQELRRKGSNAAGGESGGDGKGDEVPSTSLLARKAKVSKWHFHRVFKELTGVTPSEYYQRHDANPRTWLEASPATESTLSTDLWSLDGLSGSEPLVDGSLGDVFQESFDDIIDWSMFDQTPFDEKLPMDLGSLYNET